MTTPYMLGDKVSTMFDGRIVSCLAHPVLGNIYTIVAEGGERSEIALVSVVLERQIVMKKQSVKDVIDGKPGKQG